MTATRLRLTFTILATLLATLLAGAAAAAAQTAAGPSTRIVGGVPATRAWPAQGYLRRARRHVAAGRSSAAAGS